ncbi:MAG: SDR family NAD(P)-dependent oxidoreductase [Gammaproteobacteria bacterium]
MQFSGINAIVTGGASGLGHAVAERIIAAGGKVVLADVNGETGKAAEQALGENAHFVKTDVSNEAEVNAAVAAAGKNGPLSLAVACAGVLGNKRVLWRDGVMPSEFFANVIRINLIGSLNLAKAAADAMQHNEPGADGERGVIVNTASIAAFEGQIGQAAYAASKGGVIGMMLPLAREFARIGVRVNTIAPGIFLTPMMEKLPQEVQDSLAAMIPFPSRLGTPEEYAATVQFLVETTMMNGETIRLDGAIRMQPK